MWNALSPHHVLLLLCFAKASPARPSALFMAVIIFFGRGRDGTGRHRKDKAGQRQDGTGQDKDRTKTGRDGMGQDKENKRSIRGPSALPPQALVIFKITQRDLVFQVPGEAAGPYIGLFSFEAKQRSDGRAGGRATATNVTTTTTTTTTTGGDKTRTGKRRDGTGRDRTRQEKMPHKTS